MSQAGTYETGTSLMDVETLTGNSGGAVGADGAGNIDILGDGTIITVVGTPASNLLTITPSAALATSYVTDSGSAVPAANILNVLGDHGINTTGAGSTITALINNTITLGDLSNVAAGSDALTISTGDITFSATNNVGNLNFPDTHSSGNAGVIEFNGIRYFHNFNSSGGNANIFVGHTSGNFTLTSSRNVGVGQSTLAALTSGSRNTAMGSQTMVAVTSGMDNTGIGFDSCKGMTTGTQNTGLGAQTLLVATSAQSNIAIGSNACDELTTGTFNTAIGSSGSNRTNGALHNVTTGSFNIVIGGATAAGVGGAGTSYTGAESSNILLGNATTGVLGESNTMRLGNTGVGSGQINRVFIAGTHSITPPAASIETMVIDSNGQIGSMASSGGVTWNEETGTSVSMIINNGYVTNNASLVTATLPDTAALFSILRVVGKGAGGWLIAQNASEIIHFLGTDTTTGVGGSLASTGQYDVIELLCTVADTEWTVLSVSGNITIV